MRRAICFDTAPLIWAVRKIASPGQERMIDRAEHYVAYLADNRFSIMVPTPVVAEYLVGATATELQELELLSRGFEIPAFDLRTAVIAAELQRGGVPVSLRDEFGTPKQSIKVDAFIIATAIAHGAECIPRRKAIQEAGKRSNPDR